MPPHTLGRLYLHDDISQGKVKPGHNMRVRSLFSHIKLNRGLLPLASAASLVAIASLSSPAKALDFNWRFSLQTGSPTTSGTVTGTISGLSDNTPDQTAGFTVTVTSAPNTPPGGWLNDWTFVGGPGFTVAGGQITLYDAFFDNSLGNRLDLGSSTQFSNFLADNPFGPVFFNLGEGPGTTFFSPVPGPLPVLGAASAFGWSRRMRQRLRTAQPAAQT